MKKIIIYWIIILILSPIISITWKIINLEPQYVGHSIIVSLLYIGVLVIFILYNYKVYIIRNIFYFILFSYILEKIASSNLLWPKQQIALLIISLCILIILLIYTIKYRQLIIDASTFKLDNKYRQLIPVIVIIVVIIFIFFWYSQPISR